MCRLFPFPNPSLPLQKCRCPSPPSSSLHFSSSKFPSFSLLLLISAFASFFELAAASGQLHFQLALSPPIPRQIPSTALRRPSPQIRVEICAMEFRWLDPAAAEFGGNEGNGKNGPSEAAENIAENGNIGQQKEEEGGGGEGGENCKFGRAQLTIPPHSPSMSPFPPSSSSISLPFSHSWRQSFAFALRVWQGNDLLVHQLERIHRLSAGAGWLMRSANFSGKNEANGQRHKLDIRLRVDCAANFYGPGCDVRCELNDWERRLGRWECSKADGQKQCAPGWTGAPNCSQPTAATFAHHSQLPPANANQMENVVGGCECLNGGKCAHGAGGGGCQCPPGYGGDRCQECVKSARCRGHCQRPGECECPQGMGGQFCEKDLIYCTRHQPCQNGGLCLNDAERNYTCQCAAAFGGQNCEVPMRECGQRPCQNGGKCVAEKAHSLAAFNGNGDGVGDDGFHCECPAGIFGRFCQIRAPRGCLGDGTNPCQNGGTCAQTGELSIGPSLALREIGGQIDFKCHCAAGWSGQFCDEQFCPIGANPCQNGALCLLDSTLASGHRCQCPLGWEGPQCGRSVDDCRWAPCMNGAKCLDGHNAFQCQCADGFYGELCQHRWLPFVADGEKKQKIMSNLVVTSVEKKLPDAASGFWPTLAHLLLLLLAIIALMALLALVLFLLPTIWPELAQRQFFWQNGQRRQSKGGKCPAEGDVVQISVIADQKRGKWKREEKNAAAKMEELFEDQPPRYVSDPLEGAYGSSRFGPGQEAGAYLATARRQRMAGRILGRNSMEGDFGANSAVGTLEGNYSMEAEGGGGWAKRKNGGTNEGTIGGDGGGIQGHFGGNFGGDETDSEAGYEQIRYGQFHGIGHQQNGQRMPPSTTMPPLSQIQRPRQMPMPMASSWRESKQNCGANEEGIFVLDQRF